MSYLTKKDQFNATRDNLSYPPIPDAELFQTPNYAFEKPTIIHGWQWSTTFGRWSALVTFANGWNGFTYPKTW